MSTWPSTLTSYTDPQPTDRLNSPSHSSIESAQNDGIEKLETFIGTLSSAVGTLVYDIRAAASDGGGHVQGANKGGTGQTSYTKGDMLVASSSSVIGKLAVGLDNQILAANSSTASGLNWVNSPANKVYVNHSLLTIGPNPVETSVFSTTLTGSTIGTTNAIRTIMFVQDWATDTTQCSTLTTMFYGGQPVASIVILPTAGSLNIKGKFTHTIIGNNSANLQRHILEADLIYPATGNNINGENIQVGSPFTNPSIAGIVRAQVIGISSINSSANQTLGATMRLFTGNGSSVLVAGTIVEKITP